MSIISGPSRSGDIEQKLTVGVHGPKEAHMVLLEKIYSKIFYKILKKNDIILLLTGGHGFKVLKNCKFIEVKQGPYNAKKDKYKF